MAARLNRHHTDLVLERIQLSNLVTRLQKNALRQLKDSNTAQATTMTDGEIRSACFLIERKLARAESPKNLNLTGALSLETLITQAAAQAVSDPEPSND